MPGRIADDDELPDVEAHREPADPVVLLLRVRPELRHLADDRHGSTVLLAPQLREGLERGGRRVGARVVGVVVYDRAVLTREHLQSPALRARPPRLRGVFPA